MEEMSKHGEVGRASMVAGMDRKTARKYVKAAKLPSQLVAPRTWLTREDPFAEDWGEVVSMLTTSPGLEAKTLFELLQERHPDRYQPGQLRTLQPIRCRAEPVLENQALDRPVFQRSVVRHQRRAVFECRTGDHQIEIAFRAAQAFNRRANNGVPSHYRKPQRQHRKGLGQTLDARLILFATG